MFLYNIPGDPFMPGGMELTSHDFEINPIDANGQEVKPEDFGGNPNDPLEPFIFKFETDGVAYVLECWEYDENDGDSWMILFKGIGYQGNEDAKELTFGEKSEPEPEEGTNNLFVGDTQISTAFVGDAPVSRMYAGETLVFEASGGGDKPFAWTANPAYPIEDGAYKYYRRTGGVTMMDFAKVPDVEWKEGAAYHIIHSKMGDLGTNTLLGFDSTVSPSTNNRLTFAGEFWGHDTNGVFEPGTTMTLEEVVVESGLLMREEFTYSSASPVLGGIYFGSSLQLRMHPADAARWEAKVPLGSDFHLLNKSGTTWKLINLNRIYNGSTYSIFYFDSQVGSSELGTVYQPFTISAYEKGMIPND